MKTDMTVLQTNRAKGKLNIKELWNQYSTIVILVLMCVVLSVLTSNFLEVNNLLNVLKQISIIAILAAGMTFVILTGGIDLSVGSTVALSGVISVMLSQQGVNAIIAMAAGVAIGVAAGFVNGYLTAKVKLPAFIVTLGSFTYIRGLAYVVSAGYPIVLTDPLFKFFGSGTVLAIPTPIFIMAFIYVITFFILKYTMFGRHVYAIGGNEEAASLTGIKVGANLIKVYMISGLLSGLAGVVLAGRLYSGQPTAGVGFELDAIAAVILGGTSFTGGVGKIQGTIIGALIMGVLSNGLTLLDVSYYWQLVIKGAVIILAVLLDRLRTK
ncbi:ABC transporter permease [Bacillus sp. CGMCC 1.60114]|uniref:ABC transporter permease n=1 Tax=unclassified Bacillus (in: firmicutes) TaxID=185979 RepID=UPI003631E7D9